MDEVLPLLLGFAVAFVGSIPIAGPLAVLIVRRATRGDRRSGLFLALGGAIAEGLYALVIGIVFPLLAAFVDNLVQFARGLGAVVLLGVGALLLLRPATGESMTPQRRGTSFLLGLAAAGLNPTMLATWLLVVTTLYGMGLFEPRIATPFLFALGVVAGVVAWFALLLLAGERLMHEMTDARRLMLMRVLGGVMIALAIHFAIKLF